MKILVVNCGSSSIKYALFDVGTERELASGIVERVGDEGARIRHEGAGARLERELSIPDHGAGVRALLELLSSEGDPAPLSSVDDIAAVGHRVVHGGERFSSSVLIDDEVLAAIEECAGLAPLHNPANLSGIAAARETLPQTPQVAVFDTAFFQTMPPESYRYALPEEWYTRHRVRRYGFHGTSHRYVAERAARLLGREAPNLITLHLGNGASMTALREGRAVDQTMGLTPLEGLVMGTRSGDIDPAIIFHLVRSGLKLEEVRTALEKKSGLLGLSGGRSNDMRDLEEAAAEGDEKAELALAVFAHRVRRYLGAYLVELGHTDAIVFTGGIGENSAGTRARVLRDLEKLGITLDERKNAERSSEERSIAMEGSAIELLVVPTNEELMIARDAAALVEDPA